MVANRTAGTVYFTEPLRTVLFLLRPGCNVRGGPAQYDIRHGMNQYEVPTFTLGLR